MKLTSAAYVILGMLHERPMSGYDIKQIADKSVRHFWNVSYGQIYPELKRLTEAGLVEPEDVSTGSRQRNLYRLTDSGREELAGWARVSATEPAELRDEMMARLFFSDAVSLQERIRLVTAMRLRHEALVAQLRSLEPQAGDDHLAHPMHGEVLGFGIGFHSWMVQWCSQLEAKLSAGMGKQ